MPSHRLPAPSPIPGISLAVQPGSQTLPDSLGVLPQDAASRITLPEALRGKLVGSVLAISDEPEGGSPTGAPTGAVLATGELTRV